MTVTPFTGTLIQNETRLVPVDGTVTNPAISYLPGRNSGFSKFTSNLDVSILGVQRAALSSGGLQCISNIDVTQYLFGNGAAFTVPLMTISTIQVANSTYSVLDDTSVDSVAGGYILVNGANIGPGTLVSLGSTLASSVTFVSTSQLRAQVPALSAGSYTVTATRPDGKQAVLPLGITYSPFPVWSTSATLANVTKYTAFSQTLSATEASNANVTYALTSGSSLPPGTTLASNGLLSGNIIYDPGNTTVYSFSLDAIDSQYQNIPRAFGLTALLTSIVATGGTVTTSGAYKIHTFTTSSTFTLTSNPLNKTFDVLVVAGGGSGGSNYNGFAGGGGGGGVLYNVNIALTLQSYSITVGGAGSNSVFGALYTALAGGKGGDDSPYTPSGTSGANGGCGGGGGIFTNSGNFIGGSGGTGSQGFNGAAGYGTWGGGYGGGGGGAGGAGLGGYYSGGYSGGGGGGPGVLNSITGTDVYYAGGGGGDASNGRGSGGVGGGGQGRTTGGTANTGGGGGANASGGSGIIIIRYIP